MGSSPVLPPQAEGEIGFVAGTPPIAALWWESCQRRERRVRRFFLSGESGRSGAQGFGPGHGQVLEGDVTVEPGDGGHPVPVAFTVEFPRQDVVGK